MEQLNLTEDQVAVLKDMGFETAQAFIDNQLAAAVRKISEDKKLAIGEAVLEASDDKQAIIAEAANLDPDTLEPIADVAETPVEEAPIDEPVDAPVDEASEVTP